MSENALKVKITAHNGFVIFEAINPAEPADYWVPKDPGKFENVLMDTKTHLGISDEALALLKGIKPGRDAIGDVMWFDTNEKKFCFGWFGQPRWLGRAESMIGDRDYRVREGEFIQIPNDVPEKVKSALDILDAKEDEATDTINNWIENG